MSESKQFKDLAIVVCDGVICKWETIKDSVNPENVRLADKDEIREYYWNKLQRY
jgi:hypothetical protein